MKTLFEVLQNAIDHETDLSIRDFYCTIQANLTIKQAKTPAGKPLLEWLKNNYNC